MLAVLFSIYLLLWITDYYKKDGTRTSEEAADRATGDEGCLRSE